MPKAILHVKGIGPATAERLAVAGITTVEALAASTPEQLAVVPGFGEFRAVRTITEARKLIADDAFEVDKGKATDTSTVKKGGAKSKKGKGSKKKSSSKKKTGKEKGKKDKKGKLKKEKRKADKDKKSDSKKKAKKKKAKKKKK